MKVFYVMVLVLVAGAVPSHGRTESEGTVFNKTQPHEIMNNVTVSSSKLVAHSDLYLAMQWPMSFCSIRSCYQRPVPGYFTVHGLWPQIRLNNRPLASVDCTDRGIYGQYPLFERRQLDGSLLPVLNYYWPDLTTSISNYQCFWGTEYGKHGSCTFHNQNEYFKLTLGMVKHLGDLIHKLSGIRGGPIIPGGRYWPIDIRNAVQRVTFKMPTLHCNHVNQLLEIRFCADRYGNLLNCNGFMDCRENLVDFPSPSP